MVLPQLGCVGGRVASHPDHFFGVKRESNRGLGFANKGQRPLLRSVHSAIINASALTKKARPLAPVAPNRKRAKTGQGCPLLRASLLKLMTPLAYSRNHQV